MLTESLWNFNVNRKFKTLDVDRKFMKRGCWQKFMKLGCWQKVWETWMLTESLWNLYVNRKFMMLGCWQKEYETWMLTECLWNLDADRKFMTRNFGACLSKETLTGHWTMSISKQTSSGCTLSCIINLWNMYEVIKTFCQN